MADIKAPKELVGIWRLLETPLVETNRVWLCTGCGARIFYCQTVPQPQYLCLCGGKQWQQGGARIVH